MNKLITLFALIALVFITACTKKSESTSPSLKPSAKTSFYNLSAVDINDKSVSMNQFKNKTIVIVNTASKCGYTGQYKELEKLYKTYPNKVVVLGFPTNDFFGQEPGSNKEIAQFCSLKYNVTFPMFQKITTKGSKTSPLYKWLTDPVQNSNFRDKYFHGVDIDLSRMLIILEILDNC